MVTFSFQLVLVMEVAVGAASGTLIPLLWCNSGKLIIVISV